MHLFEGPDLGHSTCFVKESYKGKKKKNWKQHSAGFKPTTSLLRRVLSTVVLQQLLIEQDLHCHICSSIFLGNGHQLKMFGVHTARHRLFCWRIFPAYFWVVVIQTSWDFMGEWVRESMGVCVCVRACMSVIEREWERKKMCVGQHDSWPSFLMGQVLNECEVKSAKNDVGGLKEHQQRNLFSTKTCKHLQIWKMKHYLLTKLD